MVASNAERAVYTAVYGGYDALIDPVEQDIAVDWVCFTDDPTLRSRTWRVVVTDPPADTPRLASKWAKTVPHLALPDHRWTVWVDANMAADSPSFAREALSYVGDSGIAVFRHPHRDCIYDEAHACLRLPRCRDLPVLEQVESYRRQGHPARAGLYACGTIARDRDAAPVAAMGEAWFDECRRWTPRDQLSFPVVARRFDVRPTLFPHHLHRHTGLDALRCLVHRSRTVERLLARRPAPAASGGAEAETAPERPLPGLVRLTTGSNPWYEIRAHRRAS